MLKKITGFILCFASVTAYAQTNETQGWFFITHQQKLSSKFDLLMDAQLRTANKFDYLNTLLLRGALSYNFNKKHSAALGYAYKGDWEHETEGTAYTLERRLYQQYLYNFKIHRTELSARARLEQRWIKEENTRFSQRARAFVSAQIPLMADTGFTRGLYTGIQNELFLNVQHKDRVNHSLFDQNRSFVSLGYRWSKKIDTELGYMYWFQKELDGGFRRNILQVMITTKF
ncbi:DUF2490 domain-containing protein [Mucilaginibacter galii]|uniref:DUF2490 domain-containing protein n=1 Tax=Mucilaginibacter galii TaxID=2005073 RepID=A0A917N0Z4_9SPHI|nr:DUF2490 domain-containing protein [Mucilaginibacter galii]GGI50376.1 hypothetical protein GCM10011425_15880 [Mucilaginibacter galii]